MKLEKYQILALRTMAQLSTKEQDNIHMILGMTTEIGELADVFKKKLAYGKEIDQINVQEEIGDIMWYLVNLCNINGWSLEDIMENNIDKLRVRFPNKFNQKDALVRNLEEERKTLEK